MTDHTFDLVDAIFSFNEEIVGVPEREINPLDQPTKEWTVRAYNEEIFEFHEAFDREDVVGMVDANLDLIYFAVGTLKKMGLTRLQVKQCMAAIHSANMTKAKGKLAKRGDHAEDAVKPEGFVPPEAAIMQILFSED